MTDNWREIGSAEGLLGSAVGAALGIHDVLVENNETGETRTVYVNDNQTVGEAIAEGQFKD